jgi:hypothetical protein
MLELHLDWMVHRLGELAWASVSCLELPSLNHYLHVKPSSPLPEIKFYPLSQKHLFLMHLFAFMHTGTPFVYILPVPF